MRNSARHSADNSSRIRPRVGSAGRRSTVAVTIGTTVLLAAGVSTQAATAAQDAPGLGTSTSFAVLAGTTVTNTGPSVISGNLGVSPGTAITGFPPGIVQGGVQHSADAVAAEAEADMTTAMNDAAGRGPAAAASTDLGGETLDPGVYNHGSGLFLTGTVTLDGKGDPNSVFIFQAGSTLITASNSNVRLINGAQPCNVFWQVGSSATIGTNTTFAGTVMALTSISVQTGATVTGRILAQNGQVSLDTNVITRPTCAAPSDDDGSDTTPPDDGIIIDNVPPAGTTPGGTTTPDGSTTPGDSTTTSAGTPGEGTSGGGTPKGGTPGTPRTPIDGGGGDIPKGHPRTGLGGAS